jgi:ABC-type nitrate/sulfonate/bicarbonate transport system substrate-binding protein
MLRKSWLAAALAAAFFASTPALAQTKLATAKVANDFALMMGDYGNKLGLFKKHGLDVEITLITQARMVQAVVAGSIEIAMASGATLAFPSKGAPLKGVGVISGPPSILVLIVRPDGAITRLDQLRNRIVAVTNTGSLTDWAVSQIALHQRWQTPTSSACRSAIRRPGSRCSRPAPPTPPWSTSPRRSTSRSAARRRSWCASAS